jgi:hypothetical protein
LNVMRSKTKPFMTAALIFSLLIMVLSACGSGKASSTQRNTDPRPNEPSSQFLVPGKPNKIARFGEEASASERGAASAVLVQNLRARAAGDWAGQCSSLAAFVVKGLEQRGTKAGIGKECAKDLGAAAKTASPAVREDTLTGGIDALRVKGNRGWALYHGAHGIDYVIPMLRESGGWKVSSLLTNELR